MKKIKKKKVKKIRNKKKKRIKKKRERKMLIKNKIYQKKEIVLIRKHS